MDPTIAAALIAASSTGIVAIAGMVTNAWTTLRAARSVSLRDRQAVAYQQVLAFAEHRTETRRNLTGTIRYDPETAARLKGVLDSHTPPNRFELWASVLAVCPDDVKDAFMAAQKTDDAVWSARQAQAEAVELNQAEPGVADPNKAVELGASFRIRIEEAEKADARLIDVVRDRMLGTRPSGSNRSLLGKLIFTARSRTSLR